jgi:hypothetical protein
MTDAKPFTHPKEADMSKFFGSDGEHMFRREERVLSETRKMLEQRSRREAILEHIAGASLLLIFAALLYLLWALR